jgi:hypothetical protein
MPITRILALGVTLIFATALDIATSDSASAETLLATSDSASAETRWCRMIMAKCFALDKGYWVEIPLKPNQNLGLLGITGRTAEGSQPTTRPTVAGSKRVAVGRSQHPNYGSRCFTYNGRVYC